MKKKIMAAGVLAGGVALAGLAGSAYAEDGTPAAKASATKAIGAGSGPVTIACRGKGVPGKAPGRFDGKKVTLAIKAPGKLPAHAKLIKKSFVVRADGKAVPAPPPGEKGTVTFSAPKGVKIAPPKGAAGAVKIAPPAKTGGCFVVKPGAPGAPPVPAR